MNKFSLLLGVATATWLTACATTASKPASVAASPAPATTNSAPAPATGNTNAPAPQPPARGPALALALEAAQKAVDACRAIDQKIAVSVIDSGGALKVLLAADGASSRGVQSSTNKAKTALAFGTSSAQVAELAKTDAAVAAKIAADSNLNTRAGGILVKVGNDVIGAIGVGGARGSEKDEACAVAGLDLVKDRLR